MYNKNLEAVAAANMAAGLDPEHPLRLANNEKRGYTVTLGDLGTAGLGDDFKGTTSACYIGSEGHPHLAPLNPRFSFDNQELDRLITVTINREWERESWEPRRGILLMGPTGAGKTTYVRERMARQGIPMAEITWRPRMEAVDALYTRELLGGDTVVASSAIQLAARGGYPVLINEIDAAQPGELVALNEVIDTGTIVIPETGETIRAKRGFAVFATCNSSFIEDRSGAYAGTRMQNASVLNRFFKFEFQYPSEEAEAAFITSNFPGIEEAIAKQYATFVGMLRRASDPNSGGLRVDGATKRLSLEFSRRNLLDWLALTESFAYLEAKQISVPKYALGPVYTAGMPDDEVATVEHLFDIAFGITQGSVEAA